MNTDTMSVINSTFSGNSSQSTLTPAGAIGNLGSLTLYNSILASGSPNECGGITPPITDGGGNIDDDGSCFNNSTTNSTTDSNLSAHLDTLGSNGGPLIAGTPTLTIALLQGSQAIGFDHSNCPATDERGVTRANPCSAGAYEYNATATLPSLTITAPSTSLVYGASIPLSFSPTFDSSAFVAGDSTTTLASATTQPTCSTTATSASPVGSYPITCSGAVDSNYSPINYVAGSLSITQATPTITWSNPTSITYGTALGATQLNATASVPGTFAYTPPAGTVLSAGNGQTLSVSFTPTDAVNYSSASKNVSINVNQAAQTISFTSTATSPAYTNSTYTPAATSTSLLPVTITIDPTSSSVCSIDGSGHVTALTAGDCFIDANQSGNTNYLAAQQAQQKWSISFIPQTVSFTLAPPTATYGSTFVVTASSTSGLAVALSVDLSSTNVCSLSSGGSNSATFMMNASAGSCIINANQAGNASYAPATQVHTTVTAGPAATTTAISAPSSVLFGQATTIGVTVTSASGTPTGSVKVTASSGETCTANLSGGGGSCSITFATVGKKTLTAAYTPSATSNFASSATAASTAVAVNYQIGNAFPPNKMTFQKGSTIPVKFQLTNYALTPISATLAKNISSQCQATVQFDGQPPVCAVYNATSNYFQANLNTPKQAGSFTIKILWLVTSDNSLPVTSFSIPVSTK